MSPKLAKLAVTPPVVGSVRTVIFNNKAKIARRISTSRVLARAWVYRQNCRKKKYEKNIGTNFRITQKLERR